MFTVYSVNVSELYELVNCSGAETDLFGRLGDTFSFSRTFE